MAEENKEVEVNKELKKKEGVNKKLIIILSLMVFAIACFVVLFAVGIVDLVSSLISSVIILAIAVVILCFELGHKWHEK